MNKIPVAITIAGSDSCGGAGIQADLKTFAALGVHGATAITAVTAQNTLEVRAIEAISPEVIRQQIAAVAEDLGIDAGKTGMLYSKAIIEAVALEIAKYSFPIVVDPVMISKSGAQLLEHEAIEALKKHLLPIATVITPNINEAEELTGIKIEKLRDMEEAAKKIAKMGVEAVVIKGGHMHGSETIDVLYYQGEIQRLSSPRIDSRTTHGTGCSFSAAITAELAKGKSIPEAVKEAKKLVTLSIKFGINIGRGYGPVNPMANLYREAARHQVLKNLEEAKKLIEASPNIVELIPEVGMNIAMATPYASEVDDIAAIDGRIVRTTLGAKASGCPKFGCSRHLAKYLIEILKHDQRKRAAANIKYSEDILKLLERRGLTISFYDRLKEPNDIKRVEGMSIPWGVKEAIMKVGKPPDVIYHKGDVGKEPMIVLFGSDATSIARLILEIAENMSK
ncbi:MAG: bifunctional hydroxymethylpyrimidine kinase/phosphomethylpyrimidine kinase [Candidatus Bathyarchaeia archaeon]